MIVALWITRNFFTFTIHCTGQRANELWNLLHLQNDRCWATCGPQYFSMVLMMFCKYHPYLCLSWNWIVLDFRTVFAFRIHSLHPAKGSVAKWHSKARLRSQKLEWILLLVLLVWTEAMIVLMSVQDPSRAAGANFCQQFLSRNPFEINEKFYLKIDGTTLAAFC